MIRRRITFANVTSFVALFVALSAGSYAAIALAANAVDGTKVRDPSLSGRDINVATLGNGLRHLRTCCITQ
jgi:hypothetical protein